MRPETTLIAHETMFETLPQRPATRARLAGVSRIDVFDRDAGRVRLVLDEGLQLPPRPAMQPGAHALARLDTAADMRQVLHRDHGRTHPGRFHNDRLARIGLLPQASNFSRDSSRRFPCEGL